MQDLVLELRPCHEVGLASTGQILPQAEGPCLLERGRLPATCHDVTSLANGKWQYRWFRVEINLDAVLKMLKFLTENQGRSDQFLLCTNHNVLEEMHSCKYFPASARLLLQS